ncbi:MAG: O-antigen ligase family protein [Pseudomonadota bacterium]
MMKTSSAQAVESNFKNTLLEGMQTFACFLTCLLPWCFLVGAAPTEIALSSVAGLFVIRSVLAKDNAWLKSAWVKTAIGIWAYLMLTNLLMNGFALGIKHSLPWGRFVLFAVALESWVLLDKSWRQRLWWSLGGAISTALLCSLYEYFFGFDLRGRPRINGDRLSGPFRMPKVGIFLIKTSFPLLLFSMMFLVEHKRRLGKFLALGLWGVFVGFIFLSGERMALLLMGLGSVLAFLLMPRVRKFFFAANAVMGILLVMLLLCMPSQKNRFLDRSMQEFHKPLDSPYQVLMKSALRITQDFPIFGVGIRQFRNVCPNPKYGPDNSFYDRCSTHPHNYYVEWLVETGFVGLCAFLFLIGVWGMRVVRALPKMNSDPLIIGLVISISLQLWPISASGSFFNNWNSSVFWLMLGLLMFYIGETEKKNLGK